MAPSLRPRFRYYVPSSQAEICDNFKAIFNNENVDFTGSALTYHIVIDYLEKNRHFWSPQLDLSLEKYEDGTLIRGLIGPRPNVWTIFMFFYAVAGLAGVGGITIGTVQWSMNNPPIALWLIVLSGIIFLFVYFVGRTGKKIAHDESIKLHEFLIKNIEDPIELEITEM